MMPAFFDEKLEFSLFFLFFLKSLFKTVFKCHLLPLKTHHWLFLLIAFSYVYVTQSINIAALDSPLPNPAIALISLRLCAFLQHRQFHPSIHHSDFSTLVKPVLTAV